MPTSLMHTEKHANILYSCSMSSPHFGGTQTWSAAAWLAGGPWRIGGVGEREVGWREGGGKEREGREGGEGGGEKEGGEEGGKEIDHIIIHLDLQCYQTGAVRGIYSLSQVTFIVLLLANLINAAQAYVTTSQSVPEREGCCSDMPVSPSMQYTIRTCSSSEAKALAN